MGLKIINSEYEKNELSKNAMGGTEMMQAELYRRLDSDLLSNFQIVASRVRDLDPSKIKIFWAHDLAEDAEARFLQNENLRDRFDKLVFVSHWQFATYNKVLDVPYDNSIVLRNAINPFEKVEKSLDGPIRLIYHTTPHRGLNILVAAYHELSKLYGDKIHLDVFSSFKIYGWE